MKPVLVYRLLINGCLNHNRDDNTKYFLRNCLVSTYKHTKDIQFEIIVFDNRSADGSLEMIKNEFPGIVVIENKTNVGFVPQTIGL
jgi:GT2 family glycosyltransferase